MESGPLQLHKPCRLQVLGEAATSSESQEQGKREKEGRLMKDFGPKHHKIVKHVTM